MGAPSKSELQELFRDPAKFDALEAVLLAGSRLPGPRANLALAASFADASSSLDVGDEQWELLKRWVRISATDGPANNPREFLPFCAIQALGALYAGADPQRRELIERDLRAAASDSRWRLREGVALALQRIAAVDFELFRAIADRWLEDASLTEQRAVIAALAEPPLLKQPANALYALDVADRILDELLGLDPPARKTDEFTVLAKGLAYALSVFVAAEPEKGFPFLARWARQSDPQIKRIVRSNLGKSRLKRAFPDQVRGVMKELDGPLPRPLPAQGRGDGAGLVLGVE